MHLDGFAIEIDRYSVGPALYLQFTAQLILIPMLNVLCLYIVYTEVSVQCPVWLLTVFYFMFSRYVDQVFSW